MFLHIWNRTDPNVTAWGYASHLNAPKCFHSNKEVEKNWSRNWHWSTVTDIFGEFSCRRWCATTFNLYFSSDAVGHSWSACRTMLYCVAAAGVNPRNNVAVPFVLQFCWPVSLFMHCANTCVHVIYQIYLALNPTSCATPIKVREFWAQFPIVTSALQIFVVDADDDDDDDDDDE